MPTNTDRKLRVFLCHSSQDKPVVRELYKRLNAEGWVDPWLDEEKLLPGQDWRTSIEESVESADIVIICVSNNSVNKEGFIQKELRYAREIALEKPDNTLFLIPLRLEDCEVPRGLRFLQWTDFFGEPREQNYKLLIESLGVRHQQVVHREEEKVRKETEEREREEKENQVLKNAEELARRESVELARKQAEENARHEAESLARLEEEDRLEKEAKKYTAEDSLVAQDQRLTPNLNDMTRQNTNNKIAMPESNVNKKTYPFSILLAPFFLCNYLFIFSYLFVSYIVEGYFSKEYLVTKLQVVIFSSLSLLYLLFQGYFGIRDFRNFGHKSGFVIAVLSGVTILLLVILSLLFLLGVI